MSGHLISLCLVPLFLSNIKMDMHTNPQAFNSIAQKCVSYISKGSLFMKLTTENKFWILENFNKEIPKIGMRSRGIFVTTGNYCYSKISQTFPLGFQLTWFNCIFEQSMICFSHVCFLCFFFLIEANLNQCWGIVDTGFVYAHANYLLSAYHHCSWQ